MTDILKFTCALALAASVLVGPFIVFGVLAS
jgi:hypothetical protein